MYGYCVLMWALISLAGSGYLPYAGPTGIGYLALFLLSIVMWFLVVLAEATAKSSEAARTDKPAGGVSFIQYLLSIVVLTYLAWLVDMRWPPFGLSGVFILHVVLSAYALLDGLLSSVAFQRLESSQPPADLVIR
jgi:hypothetical protein